MLEALGRHAVRFAPQGKLNVGGRVLAGLGGDGLVGGTIAGAGIRWGLANDRQSTSKQDCVEHA